MTESEVMKIKETVIASVAYANSDEPVRFGDRAKATLLLDEGSEVVGIIREVQFWFNNMDYEHLIVVCIDDGDEFFYCDADGIELAVEEDDADG